MRKYLQLTSNEAIRYFIQKDKTLIPEAVHEIDFKFDNLENLKSDTCVSIVLPTHHTKPDYEMDIIQLKNLINETGKELYNSVDKRKATVITENIKEAQEHIDYSLNLDSMVLYANEYFASVARLPVNVAAGITIGKEFDLRPLYKARQQNRRYYIITLSRNVIRLIEAFNDKIEMEVDNNDFPFANTEYYVSEEVELMQDSFIDNQIKEYFNLADKRFHKYYNNNPLPVILAGNIKMTSYYQEQMDNDCMVIAHVHGSFDKMPYHEIIKRVSPEVEKYREEKQQDYMNRLDTATSAALLSTGINEIYKAAIEGTAETLYIGDTFPPNGTVENNEVLSLMKTVQDNGGNIIFVEDERMEPYSGIALVRRY